MIFSMAVDWHWVAQLLIAAVLSGIVGFERQWHGRPAGIRTHMLVCIAATMLTLVSEVWSQRAGASLRIDPGRLAAGIVTGIGFLGAGAILRIGDLVRGLTTAAGIWFVAGLGIVIGSGEIGLAAFSTAVSLFVLVGIHQFDRHIQVRHYRKLVVFARGEAVDVRWKVREVLKEFKLSVLDLEVEKSVGEGRVKLAYHLQYQGKVAATAIIDKIGNIEQIESCRWCTLQSQERPL